MIKENLRTLNLKGKKLIALTKDVSIKEIKEAIDMGITDIGERYADEAMEKFKQLGKRVKWHFLGKIKSKEAEEIVRIFDTIYTIEDYKAAKAINNAAKKQEKIQKVMIRVNMAGNKHGVEPENVTNFYNKLTGLMHLDVIGLMAESGDELVFKKMKNLNSKLKLKYLSMGSSEDYESAIEQGSDIVIIGDAIFQKGVESSKDEIFNSIFGFFKKLFAT